ncbi:MAG: AlbA family DNA-binding domain-containing protein [Sphingosinicella sp.]|uniref:AlbA family DNA-binding domain-containing protein n=1 Tax=Sphingosinicella sp. TaxID=1917971 RepID=UPI004037612D
MKTRGGPSNAAAGGRPTVDAIARGDFVENERLDFKRQLNLDDVTGRQRLVDDVVAFLNRGGGTILVGVDESEGRFAGFRPIAGDRDALGRRTISILQDGIDPTPLDIRFHCLDLVDGFVLDLEISAHRNGPFQARHSGAFLIRTAAQNRPISPAELRSYFVEEKEWLDRTVALTREESDRLAGTGKMTERGPVLQFGIVPRAFFDPVHPHFSQDAHWRSIAPSFDDRARILFKGCEGGHEAFAVGGDGKGGSRLFVRDDWFVHAWVAWPLWVEPGEKMLSLYKFKTELLPAFLNELDQFLDEQAVAGPYAVLMELTHLQRDPKVGRFFRESEAVTMLRPRFVERIAGMSDQFIELVQRSTIYG